MEDKAQNKMVEYSFSKFYAPSFSAIMLDRNDLARPFNFSYDTTVEFSLFEPQQMVHVIFVIDIRIKTITLEELTIGSILTVSEFSLKNLDVLEKNDKNNYIWPLDLVTALVALGYGTTRGALCIKSFGSILEHFVLPAINPRELSEPLLDRIKQYQDS